MPGAVTTLLVDEVANVTQELIGNSVVTFMPEIDPMMRDLLLNAASASPEWSARIGRDYLIKRRFKTNFVAGVIQGGHLNRYQQTYGGDVDSIKGTNTGVRTGFVESAANPVADPSSGALPSHFGMTMRIHALDTNLMLSRALREVQALPAVIDNELAELLAGHAKNIAQHFANSWYADGEAKIGRAHV